MRNDGSAYVEAVSICVDFFDAQPERRQLRAQRGALRGGAAGGTGVRALSLCVVVT
jgi:hypothetical protein